MHKAILLIDKSCDWYTATTGGTISIMCTTLGATTPICIFANLVSTTCTMATATTLIEKIVIESDNSAILQLSGLTVKEVVNKKTTNPILKITIAAIDKWMAIFKLITP